MRAPTIVLASLAAIALTGSLFAVSSTIGGSPGIGALFLMLPVAASACLRARRRARFALFVVSLAATAPMMAGIVITWPSSGAAVPYLAGVTAIVGGLAGMLSRTARAWHAAARAYRHIGL